MEMMGGDVTIGGIGPKPSYDVGIQMKYKNLQFFFNSAFSQVTSPFTMSYTFSPYTFDKYRTFNGLHPGFTTLSHHANLSYGQQVGNVYLRGTVTYDNSDLTHYQVITEPEVTALAAVLPVPQSVQQQLSGTQGISRYINGQEHTLGGKLQGDWNYIDNGTHRGLLTFGAEYSYFQLDDVRYTFGYNFTKLTTENDTIPMLGKGHESNLNGFIQLKHHWRSFILNAGLRFDYKNRYDGSKIREFSPRLALIYLQPKWNVKLSYSKAFIDAPYFYRKINLFLASMLGYTQYATELDPETLNSWQLTFGATQWIPGLDLEVNAFYNYAKDLIIPQLIEHTNTGFIDTYGLEFSAKYQRRRWSANLNATIQDVSQNKQAYTSYDYALNIPVVTANGVVAWQASRDLRLHAHIGFEGRQHYSYLNILPYGVYTSTINMLADYMMRLTEYVQTPNPDPAVIAKYEEQIDYFVAYADEIKPTLYSEDTLPARVLFDVGASYHLGNVTFTLDVKNLLNHSYRQSGMSTCLVPQRGRWFMASVAYKF
jgi:iron complex outermembrane receptor protein